MNVGVILAAGRGRRFGSDLPKQFAEVRGKPVLAYALEVFQASPRIDGIMVVTQPEYRGRVMSIARRWGIGKLRWVAEGGESCPISIRNGFYALRESLSDDDIAVLHMGVSPLVSAGDIAAALDVCRERGCCFTMHPVNICMARRGGDGWAEADAPKEDYIELNTPWAFRYGDVYALYRGLEARGQALGPADYTLGLWLASGRRAWYAPGSAAGRLKITTAHDRDLFEGYLMLQARKMKSEGEGRT